MGLSPSVSAALSASASAAAEGLSVDYCIFCYHGTGMLRVDNGALLTKFVSERGFILPKRFTKCCAKHQRALSRTLRRARWMNLVPWHSKLHPRLRFTSMEPPAPAAAPAAVPAAAAAAPPPPPPSGHAGIDATLADIAARSRTHAAAV